MKNIKKDIFVSTLQNLMESHKDSPKCNVVKKIKNKMSKSEIEKIKKFAKNRKNRRLPCSNAYYRKLLKNLSSFFVLGREDDLPIIDIYDYYCSLQSSKK